MERSESSPVSPWVIDALLATFVTLAIALIIATAGGGQHQPDAVAYLFALGFGALMLLRRRYPRAVLTLTVLGLFAYYTFGYPAIGVAIPVVAAVYSAAEAGRLRAAVIAGVAVIAVSWLFRLRDGESLVYLLGYELISNAALIAAAIALGDGVHTRRGRKREQEQLNQLIAEQLSRDADRRVQRERASIARDLHDVIGHTMSVISLQANVAAEAIGRDDTAAATAVDHIRDAGERTMQELRATVRILRAPKDDRRGFASLANVDSLIATATASGLAVKADLTVGSEQLSPSIDSAAYRIVQESLTNVIKHAGATRAEIYAGIRDGRLRLTVSDNGRGPQHDSPLGRGPQHGLPLRRGPQHDSPGGGSPQYGSPGGHGLAAGHGLAGMAERARLLGGSLETHATPGGGFTVEATLPVRLST